MAVTNLNRARSIPLATGQSETMNVEGADRIFINALDGAPAFSGTANIQISLDGTNWVNPTNGQALAAGDYEEITEMARFIRVDVTAYTSGVLLVNIGTEET